MNSRLNAPVLLFFITFAVMAVAVAAFSYIALALLERDIVPELEKDSEVIGSTLEQKIERALVLGIPFDKLRGVTEMIKPARDSQSGIAYIVLTDASGKVKQHVGLPDELIAKVGTASRNLISTGKIGSGDSHGGYDFRERLLHWLRPTLGVRTSDEARDRARVATLEIGSYLNTGFVINGPDGKAVGALHVGVDRRFITRQFGEIAIETLIMLLVSLLIIFEIFLFIVETGYVGPVQAIVRALSRTANGDFRVRIAVATRDRFGRLISSFNALVERTNQTYERFVQATADARGSAGRKMRDTANVLGNRYRFAAGKDAIRITASRLVDVRVPVFLFIFAEEISRPFLPLYIQGFVDESMILGKDIAVGLPISIFLLLMGLFVPISILWTGRIGRRAGFSLGAAVATVGLVGTAWAATYWDLLGWRALSAVGYAIAYGACQGHVLDHTTDSNRAVGMAHFTVATVVASITAPAIGGVLADRLGYSTTIVVGAIVAAISAVLVWRMLTGRPARDTAGPEAEVGFRHVFRAFRSARFVMFVAFGAIPAKILLTGFVYYLVPLLLTEMGQTVTEIGRVVLLVSVATFFTAPLISRVSDRFSAHGPMVGGGLLICGVSLVPILVAPGSLTVIFAVFVFGVGQAMVMTTQISLATQIFSRTFARHEQAAVVSAFRMVERTGSAIGPALAATFAATFGNQLAMALLGVVGVAAALIFSFYFMVVGVVPEIDDLAPHETLAGEPGGAR